ncbi:hypothetical protein HK104_008424 [Borealophlyctis nickersoniae]|nr:hypothetical protein HK104_008424 [Borealophlyctis nickersoniae]
MECQVNENAIVRIERVKRNIQRLRVEKSFLLQKLDEVKAREASPAPVTLTSDLGVLDASSDLDEDEVVPIPSSATRRQKVYKRRRKGDPNAPRKPTNAFFVYCQIHRQELMDGKEDGNEYSLSDATKILAKRWQGMDDEKRKRYYDLWEEDKLRYAKEMGVYSAPRSAPAIASSPPPSNGVDRSFEPTGGGGGASLELEESSDLDEPHPAGRLDDFSDV